VNLPANSTSYSVTGLAAATTYYFRVRATIGPITSPWSTGQATTQSPSPTAPAAPSALTATTASSSAINVAWTDNANNETGQTLERSTSSTFTGATSITLAANVNSYADTGLTASTTYYYRVRAANGTLLSAYSNSANATTSAVTPPPSETYTQSVTADAPVSWWRLGETAGTAAADARSANPGVYRNGALINQASLLSKDTANKSVRFDGSNDYVEVADSASLDLTSALTIETWIKPNALPASGSWASVVTKAESYSLQFNGSVLEFTLIQNGARRRLQAPAGTIVAGRTYHLVATYDGANQRLYVNGTQVASRAQTGSATVTTWPVTIASWAGWGENFNGTADEVALYSKALAPARVTAHYNAGGAVVASAASRNVKRHVTQTKAKTYKLGPAQKRTYGRKGPKAKRTKALPKRA
jgi:hypothetical protein